MKIFYKIDDNGKMRVRETSNNKAKPLDGWKETTNRELYKNDGDPAEWFDGDRRISDEELVKQGKRMDKRGLWYHKETRESARVFSLDEPIDETQYTKEAPIEGEAYQLFDRQKNKWVVDEEKKERAEKESKLGRLKAEIAEAERKRLRSRFAIEDNVATEDDYKFNEKFKAEIAVLRPQITKLEAELISA